MDRQIEKKNRISKKTIWISVFVIIGILVLYNIFFGDKSSKLNVDLEVFTFPPMPFVSLAEFFSSFKPKTMAKSSGTTVLSAPESKRPANLINLLSLFLSKTGMYGAFFKVPSGLFTCIYL